MIFFFFLGDFIFCSKSGWCTKRLGCMSVHVWSNQIIGESHRALQTANRGLSILSFAEEAFVEPGAGIGSSHCTICPRLATFYISICFLLSTKPIKTPKLTSHIPVCCKSLHWITFILQAFTSKMTEKVRSASAWTRSRCHQKLYKLHC